MNKRQLASAVLSTSLVALIILIPNSGCGSSASSDGSSPTAAPNVLSEPAVRGLLTQLPYRFRFRNVALPEGATGAVAGTVIGRHHTVVHFGIALGRNPKPVAVSQAGTSGAFYYLGAGYVLTDDLVIPGSSRVGRQFHTDLQWNEATDIEVAMEEKLCREVTGKPCQV